jgi:hypothetical protein
VTHMLQPTAERKPFAQVLAGRLHTGAGIWLWSAIVGPCAEHEPTALPPPQHDVSAVRRALVRGKLDEFHASAAAAANDEWTPRLRGDYRPHLAAVRATARGAQLASSVVARAALLGKLGEECASCHLKVGAPDSDIAPEQLREGIDPSMVAHPVAADRLREGLILPSDISWSSGMKLLLDAPKLDSDVPDVPAAAAHLRDLARRAGLPEWSSALGSSPTC